MLNWAPVVYSNLAPYPWVIVDPRGQVLAAGQHPSVMRALSCILNRALYMAVDIDGFTSQLLVEYKLTYPNGDFTDEGIEWIANSERPNEQPN